MAGGAGNARAVEQPAERYAAFGARTGLKTVRPGVSMREDFH